MKDTFYKSILCLILIIFVSHISMAQNGDVRFFVEPDNARIMLGDSNLISNTVYSFPQGIYHLEISAQGFESLDNHYFQIYANSGKDYDYKLKKVKEKKNRPELVDFLVPSLVTGTVSVGLNFLLFPIKNITDEKGQIDAYKDQLTSLERDISKSSIPTWDFTTSEINDYNTLIKTYSNAVEEYNAQVRKNNSNRDNRIIFTSSVFSASLIFFYLKEKKVLKNNLSNTELSFSVRDFNLKFNF